MRCGSADNNDDDAVYARENKCATPSRLSLAIKKKLGERKETIKSVISDPAGVCTGLIKERVPWANTHTQDFAPIYHNFLIYIFI